MKQITLLLLTICYCFVANGQEWEKQKINVDTLRYSPDSLMRYTRGNSKPGFHQYFNTAGQLIKEGMITTSRSLRFLFVLGRTKYSHKVGLWTYYKNDKIVYLESFDKKGDSTSKIEFYEDGKLKSKEYKLKNIGYYSIYFFPDGQEVKSWDDFMKWLQIDKNKK